MFTVAQRHALREQLLRLAQQDARVVAAAAVGSLAADGGDRFSDLDLSFGIADHVPVAAVLNAWTRTLIDTNGRWATRHGTTRYDACYDLAFAGGDYTVTTDHCVTGTPITHFGEVEVPCIGTQTTFRRGRHIWPFA